MNFGTNLRNLRIQRGLTQQKLADEMKVSQASITAYETNFREPSFEVVRKFSDYFGVAPSTLMPFAETSDDEFIQRIADSFIKNKQLKGLFEMVKNFGPDDMNTMMTVAKSLSAKYE